MPRLSYLMKLHFLLMKLHLLLMKLHLLLNQITNTVKGCLPQRLRVPIILCQSPYYNTKLAEISSGTRIVYPTSDLDPTLNSIQLRHFECRIFRISIDYQIVWKKDELIFYVNIDISICFRYLCNTSSRHSDTNTSEHSREHAVTNTTSDKQNFENCEQSIDNSEENINNCEDSLNKRYQRPDCESDALTHVDSKGLDFYT